MRRREFLYGAAVPAFAAAQAQTEIPAGMSLLKPRTRGGRPLLDALSDRKTIRSIRDQKLPPQMLSDLLWAAWGVNRPATRGRTAPSAMNVQEITLYVFLAQGVYRFDAAEHSLAPVLAGDHRAKTGTQDGVGTAPVTLLYVADTERYSGGGGRRGVSDAAQQLAWSNAHAGFIAQNVYLFAASEGLAAWFRAYLDAPALTKLLGLRPSEKVLYTQSVGYPA